MNEDTQQFAARWDDEETLVITIYGNTASEVAVNLRADDLPKLKELLNAVEVPTEPIRQPIPA